MGERRRIWGARRERRRTTAQVRGDLHQRALDYGLCLSDIGDMGFKTSYASDRHCSRTFHVCTRRRTHSSPASPVKLASLVGFSKRHSSPACRHRLQGGFSAPSQRIFCLRQAFYSASA